MTLRDKALELAIAEIGNEEIPRGSNWGKHVQKYLLSVGIKFPASWCMALMYWCFNEAAKTLVGKTNPMYKTGGVLLQWQKSKIFRVTGPQLGDVYIMDYGNGLGHTGIVESVTATEINGIEGNTNDTGSREGYEVCRRKRLRSKILGYLRFE